MSINSKEIRILLVLKETAGDVFLLSCHRKAVF
jgi:hypothetical protein